MRLLIFVLLLGCCPALVWAQGGHPESHGWHDFLHWFHPAYLGALALPVWIIHNRIKRHHGTAQNTK